MATAEELLAALTGSDEEDKVCVIDNDLRTISIPKTIMALGVESDDDVHRLNFRMPRYIGDVDLSEFHIQINYLNANNEGDIYVVQDKKCDSTAITFSWLVGRHAFAYKGNVNFIVCLKDVDPSWGEVLREYNTTTASLPVLEGLEVDSNPLEGELVDILSQLSALRSESLDAIEEHAWSYIYDIEDVAEIEKNGITDHADYLKSTFGDDYDTTVKQYRTRATAITETVQGETIVVDDASDDYARGLRVFGKSEQVTTTGKNLLDISKLSGSGITVTGNIITTSPNSTGQAVIPYQTLGELLMANAGDEVILSGSTTGTDRLYIINTSYSWKFGTSVTLTDEMLASEIYLYGGTSNGAKATIRNLMIRHSYISDDTYEPYSGGVASPSPEYPQDIVSIESPTLRISGKNLLKNVAASSTSNGIKFTVNEDGSVTVNGTATAGAWLNISGSFTLGKGTYILSGCPEGGAYGSTYVLSSTLVADYGNPKTFTLEEETSIVVNIGVYSGCTVNNLTFYPMIRLASVEDDTYEPYKDRQDLTISTVANIPGVPVTSGGNYTDENGQQWICDEVDFERGVYVQRIFVQEFTGEESWTINPLAESLGTVAYHIYNNTGDMEFALGLCSHFVNGGQWSSGLNSKTNVFWTANTTTTVFKTDGAQSLDEFKSFIRSEYESGNPVTLYSVLRTPRETPLPDADLATYNVLHTNYPNTVVLNDAGAHMELKYNADTQTYLENCFRPTDEQVQAAVDAWLTAHFSSAEGVSF